MRHVNTLPVQRTSPRRAVRRESMAYHGPPGAMASTTVCVRDLPENCTRREFRNLVALLPGFEDSSISGGQATQKPLVAFAKFSDTQSAASALRSLDRYVFDEDAPLRVLQVEMARRDLEVRVRNPRQPPRQMQQPYGMDHGHHGHNGMHMPPPPMYGGPPHHQQFGGPPPMHGYGGPPMHGYGGPQMHGYGSPGGPGGDGRSQKRGRYDGARALAQEPRPLSPADPPPPSISALSHLCPPPLPSALCRSGSGHDERRHHLLPQAAARHARPSQVSAWTGLQPGLQPTPRALAAACRDRRRRAARMQASPAAPRPNTYSRTHTRRAGATDAMILDLIGQLPGYLTMNFVPGTGSGPVAFALFQDNAHAQEALNALQGRTICEAPVLAQVGAASPPHTTTITHSRPAATCRPSLS